MNNDTPDQPPEWEPNPNHDHIVTISPGMALVNLIMGATCLFSAGMLAHIAMGDKHQMEALGLAVFFTVVGFNIIWKLVSLAASWRRKKK